MKKEFTYYLILLLVTVSLLSCGGNSELPPLNESYSKNDNNPFGSAVAFQHINQMFYYNNVKTKKTAAEKSLAGNSDTASLYISISKNFYLSEADLDAVFSFVHKGNSMFISSGDFDSSFLKECNLSLRPTPFPFDVFNSMKYTAVYLQQPYFFENSSFGYYYLPFTNSFDIIKGSESRILGTNENGEPDFILVFYGKGRFYLHCEPRAFSNYFLLQHDNYKYLQQALSFMPAVPEHVLWDDYYNHRNTRPSPGDNSFSLMQYPALAWAVWLSILLFGLYLFFASKRRQRIVKPIQPNENTSVAFTETVSRLYLQNKDNRNMADKMIAYFFEHLRNQYFITAINMSDEFCSTLSRKSDVPRQQVDELVRTITRIQQQPAINDQQLLSLNHQIENFYKHRQ